MVKNQKQQEVPAEMKPKPTATEPDNTDKAMPAVSSSVTDMKSGQQTVEKPILAEYDEVENETMTRDEFRPFYQVQKRLPVAVVRDDVKDTLSNLPVPDIPDVLNTEDEDGITDVKFRVAPGGLSLHEVCLQHACGLLMYK